MKVFLFYIALAYIALSVQATLFEGIKPDFILVIVCSYSLKYGRTNGVVYGALAGLLIDTVNGFLIGPNIIGKSIAAFFVKTLRDNLYQWNIFINTLAICIFSVINVVVVYMCLDLFSEVQFINRSIVISVKEVIYTVVVSLVLYPVFNPAKETKGI
jgi:rod shape-determining protein MreD